MVRRRKHAKHKSGLKLTKRIVTTRDGLALGSACVTPAADRAYSALMKAAERIGTAHYRSGLYRVQRRRGRVVRGYSITDAHRAVIDASSAVCRGKITPDAAMAVLHEYDVTAAASRKIHAVWR